MTRLLAIAAALLTLAIYFALLWWILQPVPRPYNYDWPGKRSVIERMKFHGIEGAICEGDQCYFIRDGRRCKL